MAHIPARAVGQRPGAQPGQQPGAHERGLPAARRAEDRQERGGPELLEQALNLAVAPEEEPGVLLAEDLQSAIRGDVVIGDHRHVRTERQPLDRVDEVLARPRVIDAAAQVDPRARAQEVRQAVGIERLRDAGQQDGEHPEVQLRRGAIDRDGDLLARPGPEVVGADEHRARLGRVERCSELALPVCAGRQRPLVEPRLEAGPLQVFGDSLDDLAFTAVVGQKDVESLRSSGHSATRYVPAQGACVTCDASARR
jgi:hypothetical protein